MASLTHVSVKGGGSFKQLVAALEEAGATWAGRAFGGQKGHPLRNPHRIGKPCQARHHCRNADCIVCRACDGGDVTHQTAQEVCDLYQQHLAHNARLLDLAVTLADENARLADHCALGEPCHIDVLIDMTVRHTGLGPRQALHVFGMRTETKNAW